MLLDEIVNQLTFVRIPTKRRHLELLLNFDRYNPEFSYLRKIRIPVQSIPLH